MYKKFFKRPIDIFCALAAIIVFSWLYIIVAILVRTKLGSPVIFKQERPGLTGLAQVNGRNAISWEEKFDLL